MDIKDLQLNALLEITQAVNNNLPEEDLFRIYKFSLLADLKIKKLALYAELDDEWVCRVNFGTEKKFIDSDLPNYYKGLLTDEKVNDSEFDEFGSVFPVRHKNELLAVVFISADAEQMVKNRFLNALTNITMVAIENKKLARKQLEQEAYKRELEIAKKVQNFLFPKELPKVERLKIEAYYLPHNDVGGDYYDYIQIDKNRTLICIADVSGKGIPAALLMSNFQASLHALIRRVDNLEEIIMELNHSTYVSGNAENFITFFIAIYDFSTSTLSYANCGHNEIILKRGDEIELLTEGTTVLGMFDPLPFVETKEIEAIDDFFIFAYTDGLTETANTSEDFYGFERLMDLMANSQTKDLSKFHQKILESLDEFKGPVSYQDDVTMLSCRIQNK